MLKQQVKLNSNETKEQNFSDESHELQLRFFMKIDLLIQTFMGAEIMDILTRGAPPPPKEPLLHLLSRPSHICI